MNQLELWDYRPVHPDRLPTLKVAIYKHGEFLRIVEIPDPRVKFCEAYNGITSDQTIAMPVEPEGGDAC